MKRTMTVVSAFGLSACAGLAVAQPTIDGVLTPADLGSYGAVRWVQTNASSREPSGGPCNPGNIGTPSNATKGIEVKVPLADIGSPSGSIKVCVFLNNSGHGSISNQALGSFPALNAGVGEPRQADFSAITGNQFVTVAATAGAAPVVDGTLDAGTYGAALATQLNATNFGDNTDATPQVANGSELDQIFGVIRGGALYLMITGNQSSDFTKLEVFLDTGVGGFNQLTQALVMPDVDFSALQRMQGDATNPGLKFDAGFNAHFYLTWGTGGSPANHYPNFADLTGALPSGYLGNVVTGSGSGVPAAGDITNGVQVAIDNSNVGGVVATCPPPATPTSNPGSEIDNLYGYIDRGTNKLYLFIGGNVKTDFSSKLSLFFSVGAAGGGQNVMRNDNPNIDFDHLNNFGGNGVDPGLTFDAGFSANYWMSFGNGNGEQYINAVVIRGNGRLRDGGGNSLDYGVYDGGPRATNNPINLDGPRLDVQDGFTANVYANYAPRLSGASLLVDPLHPVGVPNAVLATIDNSNGGGVTFNTVPAGAAAAVTTGVEIAVRLDELGWDGTSCIRIAGMLTDGDYNTLYNQVIGSLPGGAAATDPGNVRLVNFATTAGNQYVEICAPALCHGTCVADFDDGSGLGHPDGGVTIDDLLYYLAIFDQGAICADVDDGSGTGTQDGGVTIDDLLYYLLRFDLGC